MECPEIARTEVQNANLVVKNVKEKSNNYDN